MRKRARFHVGGDGARELRAHAVSDVCRDKGIARKHEARTSRKARRLDSLEGAACTRLALLPAELCGSTRHLASLVTESRGLRDRIRIGRTNRDRTHGDVLSEAAAATHIHDEARRKLAHGPREHGARGCRADACRHKRDGSLATVGPLDPGARALERAHRRAYLAGRARTAPLPAAREWVSDRAKVGAEGRNGGSLFSHRRDNENINVRSHGASIS